MSSKLKNLVKLAYKTFSVTSNHLTRLSHVDSPDNFSKLCSLLSTINKNDIDFTLFEDLNQIKNELKQDLTLEKLIEKKYQETNDEIEEVKFQNLMTYVKGDAPVLYMNIYESSLISLSLFIIKKGQLLPIHNHPNMNGLIKVIHGEGTIKSFTTINSDSNNPLIQTTQDYSKLIKENVSEIITLSPLSNNIHEIRASDNCDLVFLDLLTPPYENDCAYYEIANEGDSSDILELKKVPCPDNYYCDSLLYTGLTV
jgi:cysteamine dioxygenase